MSLLPKYQRQIRRLKRCLRVCEVTVKGGENMNTAQSVASTQSTQGKTGKNTSPSASVMGTAPAMGFLSLLAQLVQPPQTNGGGQGAKSTKNPVPPSKFAPSQKSHEFGIGQAPVVSTGPTEKTAAKPVQPARAPSNAKNGGHGPGTPVRPSAKVSLEAVPKSLTPAMTEAKRTGGMVSHAALGTAPYKGGQVETQIVSTMAPKHVSKTASLATDTKTMQTQSVLASGVPLVQTDKSAVMPAYSPQGISATQTSLSHQSLTMVQPGQNPTPPVPAAAKQQPVAQAVASSLMQNAVTVTGGKRQVKPPVTHKQVASSILPLPTAGPKGVTKSVGLASGVRPKSHHLQPLYWGQRGNGEQLPNPNASVQGLSFGQQLANVNANQTNGLGQTSGLPVWTVNHPNHTEMFSQMVLQQTQNGVAQLKVQVHPEGLGNIVIAVTQHGEGVQVHVEANVMQTMQMLTHQTEQLMNAMRNAGVAVSGLQVSFGSAVLGDAKGQQQPSKRQKQESSPSVGRSLSVQASGRDQNRLVIPSGDSPSQSLSIQV
jgi:hypothetical protein